MDIVKQIVALSVGGILGVNARYWFTLWISKWLGPPFPWPTLLINVLGSFCIGFVVVVLTRWWPYPYARLFVVTGFLGGYTTYSSFAYESFALWEQGARGLSLAYMTATVVAGFVAVLLGVSAARGIADLEVRTAAPGPATAPVQGSQPEPRP